MKEDIPIYRRRATNLVFTVLSWLVLALWFCFFIPFAFALVYEDLIAIIISAFCMLIILPLAVFLPLYATRMFIPIIEITEELIIKKKGNKVVSSLAWSEIIEIVSFKQLGSQTKWYFFSDFLINSKRIRKYEKTKVIGIRLKNNDKTLIELIRKYARVELVEKNFTFF